jgi:hypothetical protein
MMKTLFRFMLAGIMFLYGCGGPKSVIETVPVSPSSSELQTGYVYALPLTTFKVTVDVVKTRTIRGPYYRFAEKYLSIRNAPDRNSTSWRIDRINLKSVEEADPEQMYLVREVSGQQDLSTVLKLSQQGLIYDFNVGRFLESKRFFGAPADPYEGLVYTDLTDRANIVLSIDTSYKSIMMDSTFIKVPVTKQQLIVKTIDEKAKEAASVILKIRRKRVNVLTGKGEIPVSDAGILKLDELEKEYLALFIGKNIEERKRFTLYFTPSAGEVFEHKELFEFSSERGILTQHLDDSDVVSLTIKRKREVEGLNNYGLGRQLPMQTNALYYRVPDLAEVQINIGDDILLMERASVYQYGAILSMPVSLAGR